VTPGFPKSLISVGDADPLATQSYELARALRLQGVEVVTLFFDQPEAPALPHEYQFDLRLPQARQALERSVGFLEALHCACALARFGRWALNCRRQTRERTHEVDQRRVSGMGCRLQHRAADGLSVGTRHYAAWR